MSMVQTRRKYSNDLGKGLLLLLVASSSPIYAQESGGASQAASNLATTETSQTRAASLDPYRPTNPTEEQILGDSIQPGDVAPPAEARMLRALTSGLNQEIIANVEQGLFTRAKTKVDWRTYSLFPYKNLAGEDVNAPLGIVIHETANNKSIIWNEIAYMDNNWTSAFVHAFVDQDNIVEIHDPRYGAWGAGKIGNQYYLHIELVEHPEDQTAFMKSILNDAHYAAQKLLQFGLTPSRPSGLLGDPSGTIWSHHEVSSYLGGTNHTDPTDYFKQFNYSMAEFFELVQYEYNQLQANAGNSNSSNNSNNTLTTGWQKLANGDLSYWENGQAVTGEKEIDGNTYFFAESSIMQTSWQYLKNQWYYFNPANGQRLTGWQAVDKNWYYLNESGAMATDWKKLDAWYFLAKDGQMRTDWQISNNQWYYLFGSGKMAQNWLSLNQDWYYLSSDGAMRTKWQSVNGHWYYFDQSGTMCTGWQWANGAWYYLSPSGNMGVGWQYINGQWYYFKASGAMVTGWQTIAGICYYFNPSGALI